jgi:hypothetical protein
MTAWHDQHDIDLTQGQGLGQGPKIKQSNSQTVQSKISFIKQNFFFHNLFFRLFSGLMYLHFLVWCKSIFFFIEASFPNPKGCHIINENKESLSKASMLGFEGRT